MKALPRLLLALALTAGIVLAVAYREHLDAAALTAWVASAGAAGPLVFMAIYALATILFLPGSLLTLAGGALFGPAWGTLYNLTAATLGAALAFLIARYLAADWVQTRSGGIGKRLVQGVEAEGWRFVAFTRLMPLFPFNLLNFALGLTRIPFLHYLVATYVCMLPGALAYTWLGYAGREAAAGGEGLIQKGLIALALLAGMAFLPRLIARLREGPMMQVTGLKAGLNAGEPLLVLDVRTAADFDGSRGTSEGRSICPWKTWPSAWRLGRRPRAPHRPGLPHRPPLSQGSDPPGRTRFCPSACRPGRYDRLARPRLARRT